MYGIGKSTMLKLWLSPNFLAQINPNDNPFDLDNECIEILSSTLVYYRSDYVGINSMSCVIEKIFNALKGDKEFDSQILIEFIKKNPNPVCIMLDEVDKLAKILLDNRTGEPHQMQGYYDVLDAFSELSKICTVIVAGKTPFLYLVGRGIYRKDGLVSQCYIHHLILQSLKEEHLRLICGEFQASFGRHLKKLNLFELLDVKAENVQTFISTLVQFTGGIPRLMHSTLSEIVFLQNEKRNSYEWWMKQLTADSTFCKELSSAHAAEINVNFPDGLPGIKELRKQLYFALFSPADLNLEALVEVNGSQITVMELLSMYCLYQIDVKKFVVPLLLLKKFSGAVGTTLAWGACSVIAGGETWERLCCVSITVVYKELLPPSFVRHVAADYTLDASNIFTTHPKVTTITSIEELKENMFTIHPNQVNSYLEFVNFPGSGRILQFGPQSAMADGLIDFGTNEFVVAIIAKYYSQEQANKKFGPKFLQTELEKLKCLVEGEKKQYNVVLALFVAPFLSK